MHAFRPRRPARLLPVLLIAACALLAWPAPAGASDANGSDYIEVFFPGWESPHLTVAVQAGNAVPDELRAAAHDAIATWNATLVGAFGGAVTLTDVSDERVAAAQADIRIVLTRGYTGGVVFGGRALCSAPGCHQVLTSTTLNLYTYELVYGTTLHEIGHTLGLGHTQPIETSVDLMGYGWILDYTGVIPAISDCDLAGLAAVWAWAINNEAPQPPDVDQVAC